MIRHVANRLPPNLKFSILTKLLSRLAYKSHSTSLSLTHTIHASLSISSSSMAAVTGTSVLFQSSSSLQIKAPARFSSLKSVSLSTQGAIYPSLRMRSVPLRFRVSCAAKPETVEKVCEIVRKQLALPADSALSGESKFSALGADSLDTVEIVMGLEEAFGISVEEESAQSITTVQDAAEMIDNLLDT